MRLRVSVGGTAFGAALEDTAVARDFASLLPLELLLDDYAATEKVAALARKLKTTGSPAGVAGAAGDISYYAPWGNLAVFYRDAAYAKGLVRLGRLTDRHAIDVVSRTGSLRVRIEIET